MDQVFRRSANLFPARADMPVILGLRLRPLTLGHQFLLLSLESPFVAASREVDIPDLFAAIFLCAQDWRKAERSLRAWWLPAYFHFWTFANRRKVLALELRRFHAWFSEQIEAPEFKAPKGGAIGECGAPRPWIRLLFLMHVLHLSEAQALDTPICKANALYATWADWSGNAEILHTPQYDRLWEFARTEDAKRFNADGTRINGN